MRLLGLTGTMAAALLTAAAPAHAAADTTLTGTVEVIAAITFSGNVPASAPISAEAGFFYDVTGASQNGSVTASVKRSGKTATVTLHLPYRFTAPENPKLLGVTLTVTAQTPLASYANISVELPIPANGATTIVKLPISI